MKSSLSIFIFLFLFIGFTKGREIVKKRVTVSPKTPKNVCFICKCSEPVVDCKNKGLVTTNYTWPLWPNAQINLQSNFIVEVQKFPFSKASNLSLAHNRIRSIRNKAFEDLTYLVELDLSKNYLSNLHPEVFYGQYDMEHYRPLKYLRILDLSHNLIETLHNDLFIHLPNLEILNLSYNPIKSIDDSTRIALSKIFYIKVLDLSFTGIATLPGYILHNSYFLKYLNLEGNNFVEVPQKFIDDGHSFIHINLDKNLLNVSQISPYDNGNNNNLELRFINDSSTEEP